MLNETFESRVKIQQIIENQLPEFIISESPKASEFLKQYYISQEFQSGPIDIAENLDQYLKLDNFTPEVIKGSTTLTQNVSLDSKIIFVDSTKGFPSKYGLLKIDDEIITYTGITTNSFTGCIRGFSGITNYHSSSNPEELVFSTSESQEHLSGSTENPKPVLNLSSLFLKEFYKKIKFSFTPGLENSEFVPELNVNNFIKEARTLYQSKGTEESFKILFKVLYGKEPKVIDLEQFLIKPSSSNFIRREIIITERLSGNPLNLVGQTIRRSKDDLTQASVSEVEILSRRNRTYYKLSLFVGYNDRDLIEGQFKVAGKTKCLDNVSIGSSTILVDSTIGFSKSGTLIVNTDDNVNIISYTDKTVNQFLGCTGVETQIPLATDIKSDETIYGYENGDITKKVELRITGILSKFTPSSDISVTNEGEKIYIKNLGDYIVNNNENPSYKEVFAKSWIYNTSCRYELENFTQQTNQFILKAESDKSSLKINDFVDIIDRGNGQPAKSFLKVVEISFDKKVVTLDQSFQPELDQNFNPKKYDLRRRIKKSSSTITPLEYNGEMSANIQNLYSDIDQNNYEYGYIASNGLPEYPIIINFGTIEYSKNSDILLENFNQETQSYSSLRFPTQVKFLTGDALIYHAEKTEIIGLINNSKYYVEVLSDNVIRLYTSRSFIETDNFIDLRYPETGSESGYHRFILEKYISNLITHQKNLKKFPLFKNINTSGLTYETSAGPVGTLINGVEIIGMKSLDKVYYGPLKSISILNSGTNYDVVNPPKIIISQPENGTQALAQPVLSGSIADVLVDPQDFDVIDISKNSITASVTGGNGSGTVLQPVISERYREIEFDARLISDGGGINVSNETITFSSDHNLLNGEVIIYNSNGNNELGVGTYFAGNEKTGETLSNNGSYYVEKVNNKSIKIYNSFSDYSSGINTVGFTTENTFGLHKFRTVEKYTLKSIRVINPGTQYENRKLYVESSGISTSTHSISFKKHNFKEGDVVIYTYENGSSPVIGLSTDVQYKVIKIDEDNFRLTNIGVGGTDESSYISKNYVKFSYSGTGYQIFQYPPIKIVVNGLFNNQSQSVIATPVVRGSITDVYLYSTGTGYGSTVLNFEKQPIIRVATGKDAEVFPVVKDGKIVDVTVNFGGYEYNSIPDLVVSGTGFGAKLRAIIENEKVVDVTVLNSGIGYDNTTKITVVSPGNGAAFSSKIRDLTINERIRYNQDEVYIENQNSLKYGIISYPNQSSTNISGTVGISTVYLGDVSQNQGYSPIIGWAYDGNPIYGPYAPIDPTNLNSQIVTMRSGYVLDKTKVYDRPNISDNIIFVEDYSFEDVGTLDKNNGRYAKTLEFPQGTYAYYATINDLTLVPEFPYFIGNEYKSPIIEENFSINQDFNFEDSNLRRNTFPYCLNNEYIDNDFIVESNEIIEQSTIIENVSKGSVEFLEIVNSGDGYRVGDNLVFDNKDTFGGGIVAKINEIKGEDVVSIASSAISLENSILVWDKNSIIVKTSIPHNFINNDIVSISGLTTYINKVNGSHKIGVSTANCVLLKEIPSSATGIVTDIQVSYIPSQISIGSSLLIGNEILTVLNTFTQESVIRVKRGQSDVTSHSISKDVNILPDTFTILLSTEYFDSSINDKVFFNPKISIGIGTTAGSGIETSFTIGDIEKTIFIPTQSIYIPNHSFKTGQKIVFTRGSSTINVSNTSTSTQFQIPFSGTTQDLYVINKSKDYIGITTLVGLTTSTEGLFFRSNGSNQYEYSFESQFTQIKGNINKIKATVSISTSHNLLNNDTVRLSVIPNNLTGIGSSDKIRVIYNEQYNKLLLNPIGFTSSAVNKDLNTIYLPAHGLKTGDKVFYQVSSGLVASGLNTGGYFVYKIDNNTIQLAQTIYDVNLPYPNIIGISSVGGNNQSISLINPPIEICKNSKIFFDTSNSTLSGYKFELFYDKDFKNKFVSIGNSSEFNYVSTGSSVTLNYSDNLPEKLYYTITKKGLPVISDYDVKNYSEIIYIDSVYTNSYKITGVGSTTFDICLNGVPEKLNYTSNNLTKIEYFTKSKNAFGGISKINLINGGLNYKKLPKFSGVNSNFGVGANIVPRSSSIGKVVKIRFLEQGFDYPSDNTLKPTAEITPLVSIKNSNTISDIEIINGGKNYIIPPSLLIYDVSENEVIGNGSLTCNISSGSVTSINIDIKPQGLKDSEHKVFAVNNSNGIGINQVQKLTSTSFELYLTTPITGYASSIFSEGDQVFVEGIGKSTGSGSGFNSSDYQYKFFTVKNYYNTVPAKVEIDLSDLTDEVGEPIENVNDFAIIVNKNNYPEFKVIQTSSTFKNGEKILVFENGVFVEKDLFIIGSESGYIDLRIFGKYTPKVGQLIKGKISGTIATISTIEFNRGVFEISYSNRIDYGWINDTGKLSESYQVCPDNDYYQNLSYTVKSEIEFERMIDPVNRLLHTSGLKNFADTEVISSASVGIGSTSADITVLDVLTESRVDTINNFDQGSDINIRGNKSKFIKLKNKKVSDYFKCLTNRVLIIDDISEFFDDSETNQTFFDKQFSVIDFVTNNYSRYLIQIVDTDKNDVYLYETIFLTELNGEEYDGYILEKGLLSNKIDQSFGQIFLDVDDTKKPYIKFVPSDVFDNNYDIKFIKNSFNTYNENIGVTSSTKEIGFVDLCSYQNKVGISKTDTLCSFDKNKCESIFANIQVINPNLKTINYVELFVSHNNTDTFSAEYFIDDNPQLSQNIIGNFESKIDGNKIKLDFYNDENSDVIINAKIIGFGTTARDTGTDRFRGSLQQDEDVRSALISVDYDRTTSVGNVLVLNNTLFSSAKSLVKVSYGQTSALHQIVFVNAGTDSYIQEYPYVSIGHTVGMGTFGVEKVGSNSLIKFYLDSDITDEVQIQSYNEVFYKEWDNQNEYGDLSYNPLLEEYGLSRFNSINGSRVNQVSFDMKHDNIPIFAKKFTPNDVLDLNTGVFNIKDHFFSPGEKVFYTPNSTTGLASSIRISPSYMVPYEVFICPLDKDNFGISTIRENALNGSYIVGFSTHGFGNAHQFEMEKKNEKTIISIDGIVQQPLTYTPLSFELADNGGQVSASTTYFGLSGISSIKENDIIKVGNEFMRIISVGLGTTTIGPIISRGDYNIVNVDRGIFESQVGIHTDGKKIRIYRGSFNIIQNRLHFVTPPRGAGLSDKNESNLPYPTSSFSGRVYLQRDYLNNKIFDDVSDEFNGIGKTFTIQSNGLGITGISTGGGFVFINNVFQTPTTLNNNNNNFKIIESVGISSLEFSGISTIVDYDINQNELPRGGVVVSLGSTTGLGFAPLVGAAVTAIVSSGSIIAVGIGSTDVLGSGYFGQVSVAVTDTTGVGASISAVVGSGGTLSFNVNNGGSGYSNNPRIVVSSPSYENLEVSPVSRIGIGSTTKNGENLTLNLVVGAVSTTGIGSTLYEVKKFEIVNPGYGYRVGDVVKPVGLVTNKSLSSPLIDCEITVTEIFTDSFYGLQFGQFDYIDSIKSLQNGVRTVFPLYYNGELRSFEKDSFDPLSSLIDLESAFLVFVNGVIQDPGLSYQFDGGTSITFTTPPNPEDNISIFFYQGQSGIDVQEENIIETIKPGDEVRLNKNDLYPNSFAQTPRTVENIESSDEISTNVYVGLSVGQVNSIDKPLSWTKQKVDKIVSGQFTYKSRNSLETLIFPTSNIIKNLNSTDKEIFIDSAELFRYDFSQNLGIGDTTFISPEAVGGIIVTNTYPETVSAAFTATVGSSGTVTDVTIVNPGFGYTESILDLIFSYPSQEGIGIGTTSAQGTVNIINGSVTSVSISSAGAGYSITNPPQVIIKSPSFEYELVSTITKVEGFSGSISGIATISIGSSNALIFDLQFDDNYEDYSDELKIGYPILIKDTGIGSPTTSLALDGSSSIGIGTTFLDNIYIIHNISVAPGIATAQITSYVNNSLIGISSIADNLGKFSWGRLVLNPAVNRTNPVNISISGFTVSSGLSTFPYIQRKVYGIRNTGGLNI